MAEARGGSRWTEDSLDLAEHALNDYGNERDWAKMRPDEMVEIVADVLFPVGEPDASQKTINGLLDAVERLNGQKDALRRENGQLRELLDLPVGERVAAVAELAREPDDERLIERVAEELRREAGWAPNASNMRTADRLARAADLLGLLSLLSGRHPRRSPNE